MKRRILSLLLTLCLIVGLLPAVAIPHAHAAVTTATVTLFGTAVTVDLDDTTEDIPEALYWVNGEEGAVPVAATAEDDWNYSFAIIEDIPTVTVRDANYSYTATFLKATYDGELKLVYEGENAIFVPYKASSGYAFISYSAATNTAGKGKLYIEGAEDAVLNVTGGSKGVTMLGLSKKAYLYINGGTFNIERTNPGGVNGVISASYGKVFVENCTLNVKDNTGVAGKHPLVSLGNGTTYGLTITDSDVTLESNAYLTLCLGVFQSNMNGVLYHATMTVNGDSNVKIINNSNNTDSTYAYNGIGIWGRAVTVNGGTLEVDAAVKAVHTTTGNAPVLTSYNGIYNMFTAKDGEAVTEYTATTYFKVAPCDHSAVEGVEEITKNPTCTEAGSKTITYTCAYGHTWTETAEIPATGHTAGETLPDSAAGAFVTYCSVCGEAMSSEAATKLDAAYTLKIDGTSYKLSYYDIPIYTVNTNKTGYFNVTETKEVTNEETGEVTTETVTTLTAMDYASQSSTGANETNYNAKLIWHTGDAAPTLYLKDFTLSSYNEELSQWRRNSAGTTQTTAGMHTGGTAPLKIVVESNSTIKGYAGLQYQNELTIEGAEDATLTLWTQNVGIAPSSVGSQYVGNDLLSGNKLTLDVNLTVSQGSWSNATHSPHIIRVIGADLVINGGNIVTDYRGAAKSVRGIGIENSGNLYVNGGYVYSASYNAANLTEAAVEVAGNIYITGGIVEASSTNQSGMTAENFYISGGELKLNVQYAGLLLKSADGEITITGGAIEFASETAGHTPFMYSFVNEETGKNAQAAKLPTVSAPEGKKISIVAGDSKDAATEVKDTANYGYNAKYVKVEFVEKPACEHTNVTTTEEIIADATCTVAGSKKVITTCADCGEVINEEIVEIVAKDHTAQVVPGYDATCSTAGKTEGSVCAVCGEVLTEQEEIPATGEHTFDNDEDSFCNNCGYQRVTAESITLDENNKLVFVDSDETHIYHRATVYFLGEETVADITLGSLLKKVDPNAKTYWGIEDINAVKLIQKGTYVVHLSYNTAGSPKYTVVKELTVTESAAPTITVENGQLTVTDENTNNINHRATIYYLGVETVSNIYDVAALEGLDSGAKTTWGLAKINKIMFTKTGKYVVHLHYNTAGSNKITIAQQFDVVVSKPVVKRDGHKLIVTDNDLTHKNHRAVAYYIADADVDAYDEDALKALDPGAKTYWGLEKINSLQMLNPGKYVVYLHYNLANGAKQTMVMKCTISLPVPSVWLEENGQIGTYVPAEIAHRNYEIYYLGDQTVEDIRDIDALKAIDPDPIKFDNQKQIAERGMLTEKGNYVLVMYYNYLNSSRQYIAEFATLK